MTKKSSFTYLAVWILSFAVGILCNATIFGTEIFPSSDVWLPLFLNRSAIVVFCFFLAFAALFLSTDIKKAIGAVCRKNFYFIIYILFSGFVAHILGKSTPFPTKTALIILCYPVALLRLKLCLNSSYRILSLTTTFLSVFFVSLLICGIKFAFVTATILILAEISALTIKKTKPLMPFILHIVLTGVFTVLCLVIALKDNPARVEALKGWLMPSSSLVYTYVVNTLKNAPWFAFNIMNNFSFFVGSNSACTYAHLFHSFGIIPSGILVFLHYFAFVEMARRAFKFKSSNRKYMAIMCVTIMAIQFIAGFGSSFLMLPITEFGAPFITVTGIEFYILPLLMFVCLERKERKAFEFAV